MADLIRQRAARVRAARIRSGIHSYLETLAIIAEAYREGDHLALGYDTWDIYVDEEFSAARLKLPPEHRMKAVTELRLLGMSQRAIATAVGVARSTVVKDLQVDRNSPPEDRKAPLGAVIGIDGKTYARRPRKPTDGRDEMSAARKPECSPEPRRPQVPELLNPADADSELRERLHARLHAFWAGIAGVDPVRVAEVADEPLLTNIEAMCQGLNDWTKKVFDRRRRATIRAVV